ncbi:MAG: hypothetical protein HZA19_05525 [Nitrospirae bacterium]|nr:hypothetical protein [Nitrospirota bacterium]
MEESGADREGDFRKVSEPQEVKGEKRCPKCESPKWYLDNNGWKCFVCAYEETQIEAPENLEWPFPSLQTGLYPEANPKIMKELSSEALFEIGIKLLKEEKNRDALAVLNEAIKRSGCENDADIPPHYLSYLGLAMALAENRFRNGALFCERAIRKEFFNPAFYLNLGKVYFAGGYKLKAIDAFYNGLKIDGENIEIRAELQKIGVRHKPVISFLPRTHVVNKYLGLLFYNGKSQYSH